MTMRVEHLSILCAQLCLLSQVHAQTQEIYTPGYQCGVAYRAAAEAGARSDAAAEEKHLRDASRFCPGGGGYFDLAEFFVHHRRIPDAKAAFRSYLKNPAASEPKNFNSTTRACNYIDSCTGICVKVRRCPPPAPPAQKPAGKPPTGDQKPPPNTGSANGTRKSDEKQPTDSIDLGVAQLLGLEESKKLDEKQRAGSQKSPPKEVHEVVQTQPTVTTETVNTEKKTPAVVELELSTDLSGTLVRGLPGYPRGLTIGEKSTVRMPPGKYELSAHIPQLPVIARTLDLNGGNEQFSITWKPLYEQQYKTPWVEFLHSRSRPRDYKYRSLRDAAVWLGFGALTAGIGSLFAGCLFGVTGNNKPALNACYSGGPILGLGVVLFGLGIGLNFPRSLPDPGLDDRGKPAVQKPQH